jgi:WD40 repeat protein
MARRICAVLGYLPLALELAAAYLNRVGAQVTLTGYLERLGRYGALPTVDDLEDLEAVVRSSPTGHDPVTPTLRSQWDALEDEVARLLLQVAALLPEAEVIPTPRLGLLVGLSNRTKPGFRPSLDKALHCLYDYSLLEALETDHVRLHPLVREFTERHTPDVNRKSLARRACFNLTNAYGNPAVLEHHILHRPRGIDDVMTDVREALALSPKETAITAFLQEFYRFLDLEAHNLRGSQSQEMPGFVLQQLQNRATSENMGQYATSLADELRSRTVPYLIHRHPIARESPTLVRTFRGHTELVSACAITPGGKRVVSASKDGTLRVWELTTGRQTMMMVVGDYVKDCAVTPDGNRVISVGRYGLPQVWDLVTGEKLSTLEGNTRGEAHSCAITPDGNKLVVTYDADVKLWDLLTEREIHTFEGGFDKIRGHKEWVYDCVVTPDGKYAITASWDCYLMVWDLIQKEPCDSGYHYKKMTSCAITPDGAKIVSGAYDGSIELWVIERKSGIGELEDVFLRKVVFLSEPNAFKGHINAVGGCTVTPDNKYLISASWDGTLKIWDLATGCEIATLIGHNHRVVDCETTPDGKYLISASWDGTLKVWDLERIDEPRPEKGHQLWVNSCIVTPDGKKVISASSDGISKIWDIATGVELASLEGHRCVMTPDGKKVVTACTDGTLRIWDMETGAKLATLEGHNEFIKDCVVTPDGRYIVSWSVEDVFLFCRFALKIWDIASQQEKLTWAEEHFTIEYCKVTPDGARLILSLSPDFVVDSPSRIVILNLADALAGEKNVLLDLPESLESQNCAITPDGGHIVYTSPDGSLKIRDLETGDLIQTLSDDGEQLGARSLHPADVAYAVSRDGKKIVSVLDYVTLLVWDAFTGHRLATLQGHKWGINVCTITPDGNHVVSGSNDQTLRIWSLVDLREVSRLEGVARFTCIAVAPNSRDIIAGDVLGNVHFLEFNPGQLEK